MPTEILTDEERANTKTTKQAVTRREDNITQHKTRPDERQHNRAPHGSR
jgi:hypothetical protein